MKKNLYLYLSLIILGLLLMSLMFLRVINGLIQFPKVKTQGDIVVARILDRYPGTHSFVLQFQIGSEIFQRNIETSADVYLELTEKDHMEIRVLKENPRFITWEGDRFFQIAIFQLILIVISVAILFISLLVCISNLVK